MIKRRSQSCPRRTCCGFVLNSDHWRKICIEQNLLHFSLVSWLMYMSSYHVYDKSITSVGQFSALESGELLFLRVLHTEL